MTQFRQFFMLLFLVALTWFLVDSFDNWSMFSSIKTIHVQYEWFVAALIFAVLDTFFDYRSWKHYLNKCNIANKPHLHDKLLPGIFIASFASDLLPAKIGTFSRPFLLKSFLGLRLRDGSAVHFNALFSDFCAATLICSGGLFYWGYALLDIVVIMFFLLSLIAFFLLLIHLASLQGVIQRIIRSFFPAESATGISSLQYAIYHLFSKQDFFLTLIIKLFSWLALGLCLFSVIKALGYQLQLVECVFIVTISSILGILSFLPGGLLVAEASLLGFLTLLKIPIDIAIFMVFIYRLFSFWGWLLLGNLLAQFYLPQKMVRGER